MTKYINADELIAELNDDLKNDSGMYNSYIEKEARDDKIIYAIDRLKEASAADVEPVKKSTTPPERPLGR